MHPQLCWARATRRDTGYVIPHSRRHIRPIAVEVRLYPVYLAQAMYPPCNLVPVSLVHALDESLPLHVTRAAFATLCCLQWLKPVCGADCEDPGYRIRLRPAGGPHPAWLRAALIVGAPLPSVHPPARPFCNQRSLYCHQSGDVGHPLANASVCVTGVWRLDSPAGPSPTVWHASLGLHPRRLCASMLVI